MLDAIVAVGPAWWQKSGAWIAFSTLVKFLTRLIESKRVHLSVVHILTIRQYLDFILVYHIVKYVLPGLQKVIIKLGVLLTFLIIDRWPVMPCTPSSLELILSQWFYLTWRSEWNGASTGVTPYWVPLQQIKLRLQCIHCDHLPQICAEGLVAKEGCAMDRVHVRCRACPLVVILKKTFNKQQTIDQSGEPIPSKASLKIFRNLTRPCTNNGDSRPEKKNRANRAGIINKVVQTGLWGPDY